MNRILFIFSLFALIACEISLATHLDNIASDSEEAPEPVDALPFVQAQVTLEALVKGTIKLNNVFGSCARIEELKSKYEQRTDISDIEKKKFLQRSRHKINRLIIEEKKLLKSCARARRNADKANNYKKFRGNPERAINATDAQVIHYNRIFRRLKDVSGQGQISQEMYQSAFYNIESLYILHLHNKQIAFELAQSGSSETYGERPALHFEDREEDFEVKANILFTMLMRAFYFAHNHGLMNEFFSVLGTARNCLEGRFRGIHNWYRNKSLMYSVEGHAQEPLVLPESAENAVYIWLAENNDELNANPEIKGPTKKNLVRRICQSFSGCKGSDGKSITPNFVLRLLEGVLFLTPESSFDSPETSNE